MAVTIVNHPVTNETITRSKNNPEWGTIRVDSEEMVLKNNLWDKRKRTAFVRGKMEVLESMDLTKGKKLPGKIVMKESFVPFYEGQTPKVNPRTKEEIKVNGKFVYMEMEWTQDANAHDTFDKSEGVIVDAEVGGEVEVDANPVAVGA